MSKDKTWSGRFNEPVSELVKKYTGSIDFDKRLAEWDIQGSLAHAQMLTQSGVLSEDDLSAIRQGMAEIIAEIKEGTISWSLDLEDVHMNIERRLTDKIGDAGKRLHTGRSRNDQVATDIRLWLRDQITVISSVWPTAANASTVCRSAPPPLPVPPTRFNAKLPPSCWALNKSAKTRSMPYLTAILPLSSQPLLL